MGEINKEKLFLLFEKLKKDKKTLLIVFIGFIGILLIFFSEFLPPEENESEEKHIQSSIVDSTKKEELEHIIGKIKGVGKVEVMITYDGTSENVYANNVSEQIKDTETKKDEEHIILDKGNTEEGLLIKAIYPHVTGVAVVCEGGGSPTVKNEITQMLKALYNISSNSISITEMEG